MSKPSFRLQTLLSIKSNLVETLEMELSDLMSEQQRQEAGLNALQRERRTRQDLLRERGRGNLDCANLSYESAMLQGLDAHIAQQQQVVLAARQRTEEKRLELVSLMQEKKVLEKLKEKSEREWTQEMSRLEANFIDELSTAKFGRERAGYDSMGSIGK